MSLKSLIKLMSRKTVQEKRDKTQITIIKNKKKNIVTDLIDIQNSNKRLS